MSFETFYSWVRDLPIVDWHNHLDLAALAEDKPLGSLYEVWVKADPYKHRAMRICGEAERVITGDAGEDSLRSRSLSPPALFFLKIVLAIRGLLCFPEIQNFLFQICEKCHW